MKRLSQFQKERLLREQRDQRMAQPLPDDWTDWDTKRALEAAERYELAAQWALKRDRVDPELVLELLQAAADARRVAEQGRLFALSRVAASTGLSEPVDPPSDRGGQRAP
jgi:hypothetical protein